MAFTDRKTGWHLPGLAATLAVHCALLAVAATAFHVSGNMSGEGEALRLAVFDVAQVSVAEPVVQAADAVPDAGKAEAVAVAVAPRPSVAPTPPAASVQTANNTAPPLQPTALPRTVEQLPAYPIVSAPPVAASDNALPAYAASLRAAIMQHRPRGLSREGSATVAFVLDRTGRLQSARVAIPSGDARLDSMALRMVRQAAPFAPPPAELADSDLTFTIPVRFH